MYYFYAEDAKKAAKALLEKLKTKGWRIVLLGDKQYSTNHTFYLEHKNFCLGPSKTGGYCCRFGGPGNITVFDEDPNIAVLNVLEKVIAIRDSQVKIFNDAINSLELK